MQSALTVVQKKNRLFHEPTQIGSYNFTKAPAAIRLTLSRDLLLIRKRLEKSQQPSSNNVPFGAQEDYENEI